MVSRLDRYEEVVRRLPATGRSERGWVVVGRDHRGDISVRIKAGARRSLTEAEIAAEIRSAMLAALTTHRAAYVRAREEFFGSPLGASPWTDWARA